VIDVSQVPHEKRVSVAKKREEPVPEQDKYGVKHNLPLEPGASEVHAQKLHRPDLPLLDEFGMETVQFKCWRCARTDSREKNTAEAYQRNQKKLFCTACDRPDLFEWDVETMLDGSKREFLRPLTRREMHNQMSPEAHALAAKQGVAQILRHRAQVILQLTSEMEVEYMGLVKAIEAAEADVIEAEMLVSAMEKDEVGKKLNAKIKRLVAEIAEANRQNNQSKASQSDSETHRATGR